jgi:hypothetical protein
MQWEFSWRNSKIVLSQIYVKDELYFEGGMFYDY